MKIQKNVLLLLLIFLGMFSSCSEDSEPVLPIPSIENVEVGLNNNEIGVIGRDFHLNADVIAGEKIDLVRVSILPLSGEQYASPWQFELVWEQYKGTKNSNIHKHFTIPETAVEGKYQFIILITDENGTELEVVRGITLYTPENLPVDPQLNSFLISNPDNNRYAYNYQKATGDGLIKLGETLIGQVSIKNVKGSGKMYVVLINKKHNHRPESIAAIDFSKTIVWKVSEHVDFPTSRSFSNTVFNTSVSPPTVIWPTLTIGAENDNNLPVANPVTGMKSWELGDYYVGMLYQNTTYNMSLFHYTDVKLTE